MFFPKFCKICNSILYKISDDGSFISMQCVRGHSDNNCGHYSYTINIDAVRERYWVNGGFVELSFDIDIKYQTYIFVGSTNASYFKKTLYYCLDSNYELLSSYISKLKLLL